MKQQTCMANTASVADPTAAAAQSKAVLNRAIKDWGQAPFRVLKLGGPCPVSLCIVVDYLLDWAGPCLFGAGRGGEPQPPGPVEDLGRMCGFCIEKQLEACELMTGHLMVWK